MIEENYNNNNKNLEIWIDIEQSLFNLVNNILNSNYQDQELNTSIFFYISWLLYYLTSQTNHFDNYINLEKYLNKCRQYISTIKSNEEVELFKKMIIKVSGEIFLKTKTLVLSNQNHQFIIELLLNSIKKFSGFLADNKMNIKSLLTNSSISISKDKNETDYSYLNLLENGQYKILKDILESFFVFAEKFTNDVTSSKKVFKEIEEFLKNNSLSTLEINDIIEVILVYFFYRSKSSGHSGKIILSSIFEFLCDKYNTSNYVEIPLVTEENKLEIEKQSTQIQSNLHLLYDIICSHYEIMLTDQILNERYMQYFARIFIEDTLSEVLCNIQISDEKFLVRLQEILEVNLNPCKLIINFISNISKLFLFGQNLELKYQNQNALNIELLDKMLKKLITFLSKFSNFHLKEKSILDRDEFFHIINNFSPRHQKLRLNYIMFFIKFFIFVEFNFKLELEFIHRKKIYLTITEIFYELIVNFNNYQNSFINIDEYCKLIEVLIIIIKTYSKNNYEDGYLIYKMLALIIKKLNKSENNEKNFTSSKYFKKEIDLHQNLDVQSLTSKINNNEDLNLIQIVMVFSIINIVLYLLSG
jgi:hypothetical protein